MLVHRRLSEGKVRLSPYLPVNKTDGKAILVHRIIDHNAVPVQVLKHLEATAMHVVLVCIPLKVVAFYLSLSRPLIASDLFDCLRGGLPVLMAGD